MTTEADRHTGERLVFRPASELPSVESIITQLEPISLAELGGAELMDRVDEKFTMNLAELRDLLALCAPAYRVLEINGQRTLRYRTTYYDDSDLNFYHEHSTGRLPRRKVRVRTYVDTGDSFLEVKLRDNRKRVSKARANITHSRKSKIEALGDLPSSYVEGIDAYALDPVMTSSFSRITLVNVEGAERVTIDSQLTFAAGNDAAMFPAVMCVEIKQRRHSPSAARSALRTLKHRPASLSKYCLGVASLVKGIPTNNFKPVLERIARLERSGTHK